MNKINLIFHSSQWDENINELQELELVDINMSSFSTTSATGEEYVDICNALNILKTYKEKDNQGVYYTGESERVAIMDVVEETNAIFQEKELLEKDNDELYEIYKEISLFGTKVSQSTLAELSSDYGVEVHVYKADKKSSHTIADENVYVKNLYVGKFSSYWVIVAYNGATYDTPLGWHEFKMYKTTAEEILKSIALNKQQIVEIDTLIKEQLKYYNTLMIKKIDLENILVRETVVSVGDKFENQLLMIEGFSPKKHTKKLLEFADVHSWGIVVSKPTEEDNVPTLLKNLRLVKIIRPMFTLMDTVPGYKEFDISAWFLLFITLFFGMIIGDAGYGAFMFTITLLITIKAAMSRKVQLTHYLLLWFSFATVVWGAITGNWFGYPPFAEIPFLSQFVIPSIGDIESAAVKEQIQLFSFRVGLAHLLFAHFWRIIRLMRVNFWQMLHDIAQGAFIIGLYYVTLWLLLDPNKYALEQAPIPVLPFIYISFGIIIITCEQGKGINFFVGIGKGLASLFTLFLGGVGTLADIISYIRLFAVGLASFAIAKSFNEMGLSVIESGAAASSIVSVLIFVAGVLVIGLGHALNLAMALLAVMVHGVRLNMLEFGMHLGMEWTGRIFSPLQKKTLSLEENR